MSRMRTMSLGLLLAPTPTPAGSSLATRYGPACLALTLLPKDSTSASLPLCPLLLQGCQADELSISQGEELEIIEDGDAEEWVKVGAG